MAKIPITVMGYHCERCLHQWIPKNYTSEPIVCPKCKSPYWNRSLKPKMEYVDFKAAIEKTLHASVIPLTWTEIRTAAKLPQMFPNNKWIHRLETDISLKRTRDLHGIIHWQLSDD